jgi:hypothetical protein
VAFAVTNRRDQVVGPNEEIRYDDVGFVVTASRTEAVIGRGGSAVAPHGTFCVVSIEVRNHAQRASYHFDPVIAALTDDQGREFSVHQRAQTVLTTESGGDTCSGEIPPGQSCTTDLAFDVADDSRGLVLRLSVSSALTEFLDGVFRGRKKIRLPPS